MNERRNAKDAVVYTFEGFRFDVTDRMVYARDGKPHPLKAKAFETLLYLVKNPRRVIERDEIMAAVWPDTVVEENNLTQHIASLRRLFGDTPNVPRFIETVPGRGYKFVSEVREQIIGESNGLVRCEKTDVNLPEADIASPRNSKPLNLKSDEKESRFWFFVFATLVLGGIALMGSFIWRGNARPASDAQLKTIAILPFKPLVAGSRNEYLEFGMAGTLIDKLNSSGEIIVRPLNSVRGFTDEGQDFLAIGRELGVDALLEGDIQTVGDKIRVSVRLISTDDGRQIWAEQFNDNFTDIFDVQDVISERVANAVRPQLTANARKRLTKHGTENPEAYRLYLLGRYHVSRLILPETQKGISYLNQAIDLDPNYALAYTELSNAYRAQALSGGLPAEEVLPRSKDAALKALEIDDTLAEAHVVAGHAALWYDRNWEESERQAKRALELEPNSASAMYLLENLYSFLGRHDEAVEFGQRARELDPLSLLYNCIEAQTLWYAGRVDKALERAMKTRELDDNFRHVHLILARIYANKGMYQDAIAEADRAQQIADHSYAIAVKGFALAKSGAATEARAIIDELAKRSERTRYHTNIAMVYTGLGDNEKALEHLEKGLEERELQLDLKVNPLWDDLRSEPRFVGLLRKMNL